MSKETHLMQGYYIYCSNTNCYFKFPFNEGDVNIFNGLRYCTILCSSGDVILILKRGRDKIE